MGKPYKKIGHSCGTKDALQTFIQDDGTIDGYCYACSTRVADPFGDNPPPEPDYKDNKKSFEEALKELRGLKARDLPTRHIRASTLKLYKTFVGLSQVDGQTPDQVYFPYFQGEKPKPSRVKVRVLDPKLMWSISNPEEKDVDLFGWRQAVEAGSKRLYITEGEFDALALYEILDKYTNKDKFTVPVPVSLPNGAGNAKRDLTRLRKKLLEHFREEDIVLVFDTDKAGQKAVQDVLSVLPSAQVATLPNKDANESLKKAPKAAFNAVQFNSGKVKNSRLVAAEDLHEAAKEQPEFGVSWPWPKLTELTRGIRLGETIYLGAGAKLGGSLPK